LHSRYTLNRSGLGSAVADQVPCRATVPIPVTVAVFPLLQDSVPLLVWQLIEVLVPGVLPGDPVKIVQVIVWFGVSIIWTLKFCRVVQLAGIVENAQAKVPEGRQVAAVSMPVPSIALNSEFVKAEKFLAIRKETTP
jgi:hypothetical protein